MSFRKVIGIILIIAGACLVFTSVYINREVEMGKGKIARGEQQVEAGKQLFKIAPPTEPIGDVLTEGAQRKIDQGKMDVAKWEHYSGWFMYGGIGCLVVGFILLFIPNKRRKS